MIIRECNVFDSLNKKYMRISRLIPTGLIYYVSTFVINQ